MAEAVSLDVLFRLLLSEIDPDLHADGNCTVKADERDNFWQVVSGNPSGLSPESFYTGLLALSRSDTICLTRKHR